MRVSQIAPENKRERRRFVRLEHDLFKHERLYVSPIRADVTKYMRGRSPFYEEMEHALFVASNGRDIARCAALLNRRWQRDKGEGAGFIGYFAAAADARAEVREMLGAAERWLAERRADRVIAPFIKRRHLPRPGRSDRRLRRGADLPLPLAAGVLPGAAGVRRLPADLSIMGIRDRLFVRALPHGLRQCAHGRPLHRPTTRQKALGHRDRDAPRGLQRDLPRGMGAPCHDERGVPRAP